MNEKGHTEYFNFSEDIE